MSYDELANQLVALESFDPKAFVEDEKAPQNVCDLVLSLTLAYNDFRDIFFAETLLKDVGVKLGDPPSTKVGLRNGLNNTVVRVRAGFVHELLNLIRDSQEAICHEAFKHVVKSLSKTGKKAWASIFDAAINRQSDDELTKALVIIRNKVAFHYDSEELGRGYRRAFIPIQEPFGKPLVSRGAMMRQTRFYFVDAAVQSYIRSRAQGTPANDFLLGKGEFVDSINQALYEIVTRFIQSRSAWEKHRAVA